MRRTPGISLYHPPARKPTVMRRYGPFAGVGLLVGAVAGLGLTQMPVGQVAAVTSAAGKDCVQQRRAGGTKRCNARQPTGDCTLKLGCERGRGADEPGSMER